MQVPKDSAIQVPNTASFFVVPMEEYAHKFASSQVTKETMCKVLRSSVTGLKVNRLTLAINNGVRVEETARDIEKLKNDTSLAKAGLNVIENAKMKPRMIVYGVPHGMSIDEMREELIAQNLGE